MALAVILRNSLKIKGCNTELPQHFVKSVSIITNRNNFTLAKENNELLSKNSSILSNQVRLMSGDHSKLWPIEKAISVALIGVVPAAIAVPNVVLDNVAAVACVIHFHWGLEACVVDYVRPVIFGNAIPKLALGLVYLISATTLGGLIYYNVNDIGIGQTIRKFWAVKE